MPTIEVKCDESPVMVGKMARIKITFRNILSRSLSRLLFLVQAQELCPQKELSYRYIHALATAIIGIRELCTLLNSQSYIT